MADHDETMSERMLRFVDVLRESTTIAQELVLTNRELGIQVRSLKAELSSERARSAFLEREITQLRDNIANVAGDGDSAAEQFQTLLEEQNSMAYLYVTADQLAHATTPREALKVVTEVLHNMLGAIHYGIWLSWDDEPVLFDHEFPPEQTETVPAIVAASLQSGKTQHADAQRPDDPPICVPFRFGGATVGALLVAKLVPQCPRLERLHRDLLELLGERFAASLVQAAQRRGEPSDTRGQWMLARAALVQE